MLKITQINVNDRAIDRQRDVCGNSTNVGALRLLSHRSTSVLRGISHRMHQVRQFMERNLGFAAFAQEAQLLGELGGHHLLLLTNGGQPAWAACSKPTCWATDRSCRPTAWYPATAGFVGRSTLETFSTFVG